MALSMEIYPRSAQGSGAFDGGKITEIKPIPFPHESGGSRRLGPLLYWAWASAQGDGVIGMHPHQGFEIMSYVLEGALGHTDSAGNNRRVGTGGAQVMQTGSGISHQEEMYGERTEFFQIWFEPNLRETLSKDPVYRDFEEEAFPVEDAGEGVRVKRVLGKDAPVQLEARAQVDDIALEAGARHRAVLPAHEVLAAVVVEGAGAWGEGSERREVSQPDFAVIKSGEDAEVVFEAGEGGARLLAIAVPLQVEYALFAGR